MIGCASLEGTDPREALAALELPSPFRSCVGAIGRPRHWPQHGTSMDLLPKEAIDQKAALRALPPLIKGYLRLGATFGSGAVIDRRFGTTDVLVILPVVHINPRYIGHFGADAEPSRRRWRTRRWRKAPSIPRDRSDSGAGRRALRVMRRFEMRLFSA